MGPMNGKFCREELDKLAVLVNPSKTSVVFYRVTGPGRETYPEI